MPSLNDRVFLVSGAASGMGKAIVERFLSEGAKVVGFSLETRCDVTHPSFVYVSGDVTNLQDCMKVVETTVEKFGKLNGLVNSAGITREGTLETMSLDTFRQTFEINVYGTFAMCKASIGELKKQPSTIVNISSNMAVKAIPERVSYNASKAAVNMMTECIALDYAPRVRANTVMPGIVDTPMIQKRIRESEDPQKLLDLYAGFYPMKRIGTVEDIVEAVLFLSCEASAWITGIHLPVCGGDK